MYSKSLHHASNLTSVTAPVKHKSYAIGIQCCNHFRGKTKKIMSDRNSCHNHPVCYFLLQAIIILQRNPPAHFGGNSQTGCQVLHVWTVQESFPVWSTSAYSIGNVKNNLNASLNWKHRIPDIPAVMVVISPERRFFENTRYLSKFAL